MIKVLKGDLLKLSTAEALVIPVNTWGVIPRKGLAAAWAAQAETEDIAAYRDFCRAGRARLGAVWFVNGRKPGTQTRFIVFFPVKGHWREKSKLPAIREGLGSLRAFVEKHKVQSICVPALGCGGSGLPWRQVRAEIERALADLVCDVYLFAPRTEKK